MEVTRIETPSGIPKYLAPEQTKEQTQIEYEYLMAEQITRDLLGNGLITEAQYKAIMERNRETFPTFLKSLY